MSSNPEAITRIETPLWGICGEDDGIGALGNLALGALPCQGEFRSWSASTGKLPSEVGQTFSQRPRIDREKILIILSPLMENVKASQFKRDL